MSGGNHEIEVRLVQPEDRLTGLSLGNEAFVPLKTFIQRHAKLYEEKGLARTYVAFLGSKLVGYITLTCGEVVTEDGADALIADVNFPFNHYPAVKIARLAVDITMQGKKLGDALVKLAIGTAKDVICPAVGCRFVTVDSKSQSVEFYKKCGFTLLESQENRARQSPIMWLDLKKNHPTPPIVEIEDHLP